MICFAQVGIVGYDDVLYCFAFCGCVYEAGASADIRYYADAAKAERFKLCDPERFVDALAELDVAALADVHEFHVVRHSVSAEMASKAELIDEDDLDVAALCVEFLNAGVEVCLSAGHVGHSFAMGDGPVVFFFHIVNVAALSLAGLGTQDKQYRGSVFGNELGI